MNTDSRDHTLRWLIPGYRCSLCLTLLLLPVALQAQYLYAVTNGTTQIEISGYTGSASRITIPSVIAGLPVTAIGAWAFDNNRTLREVIVPDSVTRIGAGAFYFCTNLVTVTLPDTVTAIEPSTFGWCTSLSEVKLPNQLTRIGEAAFSMCSSLLIINLPESLTSIESGAFEMCASLSSIAIPGGVTNINFASTFADCGQLSAVSVDPEHPEYVSLGGAVFSKGQDVLLLVPRTYSGHYAIPDGVRSVGRAAFYGCSGLTSVSIPNSVITIGEAAFGWCSQLAAVAVPSNVASIDDTAFAGCIALTSVSLPESLTYIGNETFEGCSSLTEIVIPNRVTMLGGNAFGNCQALTNIVLGSGLTAIEDATFHHCTSLRAIVFPNTISRIEGWAFDGCSRLTSITIPNSVTEIGKASFVDCAGLTNVAIGSGVTQLSDYAFGNCALLTAITVDTANPRYCSVDGVVFDKTMSEIVTCPAGRGGDYVIPTGVRFICRSAFSDCRSLISVTIPATVHAIDSGSFFNCTALVSVFFGGNAPQLRGDEFDEPPPTLYYLAGTQGWADIGTSYSMLLWNPRLVVTHVSLGHNPEIGLELSGVTGMTVIVESSVDLGNPSWTPISTNVITTSPNRVSDTSITETLGRFYRLRSP